MYCSVLQMVILRVVVAQDIRGVLLLISENKCIKLRQMNFAQLKHTGKEILVKVLEEFLDYK